DYYCQSIDDNYMFF
nr:immunoglobulin light chain junction region [Macaca mulatta]MOX79046.1 immunoglobulin light chain junction region [Macaca mulatta]